MLEKVGNDIMLYSNTRNEKNANVISINKWFKHVFAMMNFYAFRVRKKEGKICFVMEIYLNIVLGFKA